MLDKVTNVFSCDNSPIAYVDIGSTVKFRTMDCYSNLIVSSNQKSNEIDAGLINPATGPVFINGAEKDDVLIAEIIDIEVDDHGVISNWENSGPLLHIVKELKSKIVDIKDGMVYYNDVCIPIKPMIGVIGVAPLNQQIRTGKPGLHGGNMDCNTIRKGSRVYLQVNHRGGLFMLGDLHAIMGDGEICGCGVEVKGVVTVKFDLIKNYQIPSPVIETEDKWYTVCSAPSYEETLKMTCSSMHSLIMKAYSWDETDSFFYMSVAGDLEVCFGARPCRADFVLRYGIPKLSGKLLIKY